ncbi:hypothetical protein C7S15_5509 [Burkholderia cepacia]|nr:hypothetical protein [Burkholderia cepacia]
MMSVNREYREAPLTQVNGRQSPRPPIRSRRRISGQDNPGPVTRDESLPLKFGQDAIQGFVCNPKRA